MTYSCTPPETVPSGITIKESGPKVIKFSLNEVATKQVEITHDTVHAVEVIVELQQSYKVASALIQGRGVQDLPIHFWFSDKPYGMTIPRNWQNLNIISLLKDPTVIYISETTVVNHPYDISLIVVPAGKYYLNFHNRHGRSLCYQMNMFGI